MENIVKHNLVKFERMRDRIFGISICFSFIYTILARYTGFFLASRSEKILSIGAALVAAGLVYFLLLKKILNKHFFLDNLKQVILAAILVIVLISFVFQPLYYPENHTLEVLPGSEDGSQDLVIESVKRVELPKGEKLTIAPSQTEIEGGWNLEGSTGLISWLGDPDSKLVYTRMMQAGVEVVIRTGPNQGKVKVIWDGSEQIVNLNAPITSTQTILLLPKLELARLDIIWKIIVTAAYAAQFVTLVALFTFALLVPKIFVFRHFTIVLICFAALLLLFPVVQLLDPIVTFQDPQLEQKIRESLDLPEGDIRNHDLLSIAKLDLSGSGIQDLEGIQHLNNLASLNLRDNAVTSIEQIGKLDNLSELNLRGNAIIDITPLANLIKLESLNLRDNPFSDPSPIQNLTLLKDLNLHGISLKEHMHLLDNFPALEKLNIRNCAITDITSLADMMADGSIQDDPISGKRAELDIRDNPIPRFPEDGYASLRPYWVNISFRAPYILPVIKAQEPPRFSHTGGYYQADFWLEIYSPSPEAVVHYTLDGSEPSMSSPIYEQPLLISDRSGQPDQLAAINTISRQWKAPIGEVFKAAIVRAGAFYPDGTRSRTITHTFFIDNNITKRYSIPVISINADSDDLFDDIRGIYTIGKIGQELGLQFANYKQRGGEWERPVHLEIYDDSGDLLLAQDGGVRIHGATTRGYPQKSLRLYADMDYGQSEFFNASLFQGLCDSITSDPITNFKILLLRNSGNIQNYYFYRDSLIQSLVDPDVLDIQADQPVVVFINGEYWGIYDLRENLDANYLASHFHIDPEDIVILERNSQINHGEPGDEVPYQEMLDFIMENDIRNEKTYDFVSTQMDIENYIDYQISEIYARNENWPHDNIKFWRYKNEDPEADAPKGQDGKWRWLLFDLDTAFGIVGGDQAFQDNTLIEAEGEFLFRSLLKNPAFHSAFINRFADQLNTFYSPERVTSIIEVMESEIAPDVQEHLARWHILNGSLEEWEKSLGSIYTFAAERPSYVRQHIVERFGFEGTAEITLKADNEKGYIHINTIDILPTTPGILGPDAWSGVYFKGIPLSISAIPNAGYRFAGWEGIEDQNASIELSLAGDMSLTAKFLPLE